MNYSCMLSGQTKKNVCFQLPTIPKFKSPTPIFLLVSLVCLKPILLAVKCFQLQVYFCCNFVKTDLTTDTIISCFDLQMYICTSSVFIKSTSDK